MIVQNAVSSASRTAAVATTSPAPLSSIQRVISARLTPEVERKRDYLAGFLAETKPALDPGGPGGDGTSAS